MMRAGKLDRVITIERVASTVDDYGTPVEGWSTVATVRAQLVQSTLSEFMAAGGASSETSTVFRVRYLDGLTLADRVKDGPAVFDVKEIKELGRRKWLELRCTATGG